MPLCRELYNSWHLCRIALITLWLCHFPSSHMSEQQENNWKRMPVKCSKLIHSLLHKNINTVDQISWYMKRLNCARYQCILKWTDWKAVICTLLLYWLYKTERRQNILYLKWLTCFSNHMKPVFHKGSLDRCCCWWDFCNPTGQIHWQSKQSNVNIRSSGQDPQHWRSNRIRLAPIDGS